MSSFEYPAQRATQMPVQKYASFGAVDLPDRTFESVRGARQAIVHLYNSTSSLQRRVVFQLDRAGITDIAVRGAEQIARWAERMPETKIFFEYSPESYTGTELEYAVEICDA